MDAAGPRASRSALYLKRVGAGAFPHKGEPGYFLNVLESLDYRNAPSPAELGDALFQGGPVYPGKSTILNAIGGLVCGFGKRIKRS